MKRLLFSLIIVIAYTYHVNAQVDSLRYVDFHIHTSMKNYYRDVPSPELMDDTGFLKKIQVNGNWVGNRHVGCDDHNFRSGSERRMSGFQGKDSRPEASWDLIAAMDPRPLMLCTSITPIEKRFVSEERVPIGLFFLYPKIRRVNNWMVTKLSMDRQKVIHEGHSNLELMGEIKYMANQSVNPKTNKKDVRLVRDSADLKRAIDNNETGLILTVEGAHSLMDSATIGEEFSPTFGIDSTGYAQIRENIRKLKEQEYHVFFMTFSHMSWNAMCGHAKSLDMKSPIIRYLLGVQSDDKSFRELAFQRYSTGIDTFARTYHRKDDAFTVDPCVCSDPLKQQFRIRGWDVLNSLLDSGKYRILIDTRHLSIKGRQQYIRHVCQRRDSGDLIPIIVSHAAVSGKSEAQAAFFGKCPFVDRYLEVQNPKKFYDLYALCLDTIPKPDVEKTGWFHPFSINLYDEEITTVYETDGIIGITLEQRVLGTGRYNYDKDHYRELRDSFDNWALRERWTELDQRYKELKIAEPFMRNLLYIVEHSGEAGKIRSWQHVAMGSDWDGIIDPLDVCAEPGDLAHFYEILEDYLPHFADFIGKPHLLPAGYTTEELLNNLFYKNGEAFILKYFK